MKWITYSNLLAVILIILAGIAIRSISIAIYGYYNYVEVEGHLKVAGARSSRSDSRGHNSTQRMVNRLSGDQKSKYMYYLTIGDKQCLISLEKYYASGPAELLVPEDGLETMTFRTDEVLLGRKSDGLIKFLRRNRPISFHLVGVSIFGIVICLFTHFYLERDPEEDDW